MTQSTNILSPGVLLPGVNPSDPDNWPLSIMNKEKVMLH